MPRAYWTVPLLSLTLACATSPWGGGRVHRITPRDCRVQAAALGGDIPDTAWHRALITQYECPKLVGPTLARLWRDGPQPGRRQEWLGFVSEHIHSGPLYHAVLSVAADTTLSNDRRYGALEVLFSWAASPRVIRFGPLVLRGVRDSIPTVPAVTIGGYTHTFHRTGDPSIPLGFRDSIVAFLRDREQNDPSPRIQYATGRAREWLEYPSAPPPQ
jgi:hypothetical protein